MTSSIFWQVGERSMVLPSFLFAAVLTLGLRVRKGRSMQREKCLPADSDPFNDVEFGKNLACLSNQFPASADRRSKFHQRNYFLICTHDEAMSG